MPADNRPVTDPSDLSDDRESPTVNLSRAQKEQPVMSKSRKSKQRKPGNDNDTKRNTKGNTERSHNSRSPSSKDHVELPSLRDREPETFHIYATSDSSDDEIQVQSSGVLAQRRLASQASKSAQDAIASYSENDEPMSKRDSSPEEGTTQKSMSPSPHVTRPKKRKRRDPSSHSRSQDPELVFTAVNSGRPAETSMHDQESAQQEITMLANGDTFASRKGSISRSKTHLESHTCGVCGKVFGRLDTLQRHLSKKHPEEQIESIDGPGSTIVVPENHQSSRGDARISEDDHTYDGNITHRLESPVVENRQKRKRDFSNSPQPASSRPSKRRRNSSHSNLSSVQSGDGENAPDASKALKRSQKRRQSGIDEWAQRPTTTATQNISLVVPRLTHGQSSKLDSSRKDISVTGKQTRLDADRSHNSTYTSTNGKGRAKPGVNYTSPAKSKTSHSGIATSIATRTFSRTSSSIPTEDEDEDENEDPGSESDHGHSSEEGTDTVQSHKARGLRRNVCDVCLKPFASAKTLKRHLQRPGVHMTNFSCPRCSAAFVSKAKLHGHMEEVGHAQTGALRKSKGGFSEAEVEKLNRWKSRFCEDHHITAAQFNDMMTDTLQRVSSNNWKWPFIAAKDFLKQYMAVLPYRENRSMLRYRERNFQNLAGSGNWTEEDDQDLVRLVKQYGTSWAKIGKMLTRTADAVSQRWRHKLQHTEAALGEWTPDELEKLEASIEQVRRASGPLATTGEWHIPWTQVSAIMKTRTPQQCSNRWRSLHGVKRDGIWVHVPGLKKTPGSSQVTSSSKLGTSSNLGTPSKMERRLQGSTRQKHAPLSEMYVRDEDSDAEGEGEGESEVEDEVEEAAKSNTPEGDDVGIQNDKTPRAGESRNPLTNKTPGKTLGSSQLFHQTQIDTSALKPPPSRSRRSKTPSQTQDRPSPNIAIQRRPVSVSPLQEITLHRETGADESERQSTTDEEQSDAESEKTASEDGSQSQDDSQKRGPSAVNIPAEDQSSESDTSADDDEESDEEEFVGKDMTTEHSLVHEEADGMSPESSSSEEEVQDGADSQSTTTSTDEDDNQVGGNDDDDDDDDDYSENGSEDDSRAQFMNSIAKSAVRSSRSALNGGKLLSSGKKQSGTSSSEDDSD